MALSSWGENRALRGHRPREDTGPEAAQPARPSPYRQTGKGAGEAGPGGR